MWKLEEKKKIPEMFNFQGFIKFEVFKKWCHQEMNIFKNLFIMC